MKKLSTIVKIACIVAIISLMSIHIYSAKIVKTDALVEVFCEEVSVLFTDNTYTILSDDVTVWQLKELNKDLASLEGSHMGDEAEEDFEMASSLLNDAEIMYELRESVNCLFDENGVVLPGVSVEPTQYLVDSKGVEYPEFVALLQPKIDEAKEQQYAIELVNDMFLDAEARTTVRSETTREDLEKAQEAVDSLSNVTLKESLQAPLEAVDHYVTAAEEDAERAAAEQAAAAAEAEKQKQAEIERIKQEEAAELEKAAAEDEESTNSGSGSSSKPPTNGDYSDQDLSPETLSYVDVVEEECAKQGIPQYVNVVLAIIEQESGGKAADVMQSSECIGLPPNSITDPEYSIEVGVEYFAYNLEQADGDVEIALQAYNYGVAYVDYALNSGGYSLENAYAYSEYMAEVMGWDSYGNPEYVPQVQRYY